MHERILDEVLDHAAQRLALASNDHGINPVGDRAAVCDPRDAGHNHGAQLPHLVRHPAHG